MKRNSDSVSCGYMDLIELSHTDRIDPVMYCKMMIQGQFDLARFRKSIEISIQYIPEILYSVDFKRCRFVKNHHTAEDVMDTRGDEFEYISSWNLSTDTQLKIFIVQDKNVWNLTIGMSHVLTDGVGFLQYLYLLASIYNETALPSDLKNVRNMDMLLKRIPFCICRNHNAIPQKAICHYYKGNQYYCICCPVNEIHFKSICAKAKSLNVSVNDILMTAYFRVAVRRLERSVIKISCPADLRRICFDQKGLTIGNMTRLYRSVSVFVAQNDSFDTTLLQIHREIRQQRDKFTVFSWN